MSSDNQVDKEKSSLLEQIVLGVVHELNNPNAFIRLSAENLRKMLELLDPILSEYVKKHPENLVGPYSVADLRSKIFGQIDGILLATLRIIGIADNLKHCTSHHLMTTSEISLKEVLQRVIENHRFLLDRCAQVEFTSSQRESYLVVGYRLQLEQVFSNIIANACDAIAVRHGMSDSIDGRIMIHMKETSEGIMTTLSDNGCGMDPETARQVFKPFFSTKQKGASDGLGLPICQTVISAHGGKIEVTSRRNVGTQVMILIPKNMMGPIKKSDIRILVIDGDQGILDVFETRLTLEGYYVRTASEGKKGLEMFQKSPFHIVLVDVNIPVADAADLLKSIKHLREETVLILLTDASSSEKALAVRFQGAFDYILKPFADLSEIGSVFDRAVSVLSRWKAILDQNRNA